MNSLFSDINSGIDVNNNILSNSSNNSSDFPIINNRELLAFNYNYNNNSREIEESNLFPNNPNDKEESIGHLYDIPNINNININNNISKSIISSNNNSQNNSSKVFQVIISETSNIKYEISSKYIKKGRKYNKLNKRIHSGGDDDNLIRKIQVHFITFIINFCNDIINTIITDKNAPHFKDIDHKIKKTVNHKRIEYLKNLTLAHIVQLKPSSKMKNNDISVNKNIYEEICQLSPFIQEFLQMNYLDLFKQYYNNKSKLFEVNGKIILISKKTKTFNDLLKKYDIYKKRLNYIAINYFLNRYKRIKKPKFRTSISNQPRIITDED